MRTWPARDARARFSELLDAAIKKGPQLVTRRGMEIAILVSIEEWQRLQGAARPGPNALSLSPEASFETLLPETRHSRRRR